MRLKKVLQCKNPPRYFINGYGPTENTTFSTTYTRSSTEPYCNMIPIGKPINNTKIYILNKRLQLVPNGVPGTLYVSGSGIGEYYGRPELNKKSFIANSFLTAEDRQNNQHLVLYNTGDLAYWDHQGLVHHIGRSDLQVKINGFRIELTEIENALSVYPHIKQSVVMVEQNNLAHKKLIAFISTEQQFEFDGRCLNAFIKEKLPAYMVPSVYYCVAQFPINLNGKVDRQKLKDMDLTPYYIHDTDPAAKPATTVQIVLVKLYSDLLDIPESRISIHDAFFNLGGNSITLIKLHQHIKTMFAVNIPFTELYQQLTVNQRIVIFSLRKTFDNKSGCKISS